MNDNLLHPSSPSCQHKMGYPRRSTTYGDRFIPNRQSMDMAIAQCYLSTHDDTQISNGIPPSNPQTPSSSTDNTKLNVNTLYQSIQHKSTLVEHMFDTDYANLLLKSSCLDPCVALRNPFTRNIHTRHQRTKVSTTTTTLGPSSNIIHPYACKLMRFKRQSLLFKPTHLHMLHTSHHHHHHHHRMSPSTSSWRSSSFPTEAEQILDVANVKDDFYTNNLDWSALNLLSIAIDNTIWSSLSSPTSSSSCSPAFKNPKCLFTTLDNDQEAQVHYITAITSNNNGNTLAVATSTGDVYWIDPHVGKLIHRTQLDNVRICAMGWRDNSCLTTGALNLVNLDIRTPNRPTSTYPGTHEQICGLQWSPDGEWLASGCNDNVVSIWSHHTTSSNPLHRLDQHQGAVKAIDWCPWKRHQLATGGGMRDQTIKIWNTQTGCCLNSIATHAQVSSLRWSRLTHDLIATHGQTQPHIAIWNYSTHRKLAHINYGSDRILHMCMNPIGTHIATVGADEILCIWDLYSKQYQCYTPPRIPRQIQINQAMKTIR